MAEHRPLVVINRRLRALPAGDTLVASSIPGQSGGQAYAPLDHSHAIATSDAAGFMSAQDKAQLQALELTGIDGGSFY